MKAGGFGGEWEVGYVITWLGVGVNEAKCAAVIQESILAHACCSLEAAMACARGAAHTRALLLCRCVMYAMLRALTAVGGAVETLLWLVKPLSEIALEPSPGNALLLLLLWRHTECQKIIWGALVVKFSPKEYWAGGGNCKIILILLYTESLALLTVAYCFLPQSSAQSLSGRGYSVSYFKAIFFTSVDVDCRGLQYLLHIHWCERNAEHQKWS